MPENKFTRGIDLVLDGLRCGWNNRNTEHDVKTWLDNPGKAHVLDKYAILAIIGLLQSQNSILLGTRRELEKLNAKIGKKERVDKNLAQSNVELRQEVKRLSEKPAAPPADMLDIVYKLMNQQSRPFNFEQVSIVDEVLKTLTEKEEKVIRLRIYDGMTLEEVAGIFGVTRERVRQIESKAMGKINNPRNRKRLLDAWDNDQ